MQHLRPLASLRVLLLHGALLVAVVLVQHLRPLASLLVLLRLHSILHEKERVPILQLIDVLHLGKRRAVKNDAEPLHVRELGGALVLEEVEAVIVGVDHDLAGVIVADDGARHGAQSKKRKEQR